MTRSKESLHLWAPEVHALAVPTVSVVLPDSLHSVEPNVVGSYLWLSCLALGTVTFGSANMSHLANWDTRAAVGYLSFQLLLVIASGCITWRSSCIRFVADSRQRFIPWLALFFALSIGVQGQLASSPWPMFGGDAAHTGRSLYNGPTGPAVIVKWNYTMTGQVYCFPAIGVDGTVYTSSFGDSNVVALTGTTGAPKWNYTGGGMFASTPAIGGDGTIYVGSYDKKVYALNATTGALKWNYTTGSDVSSPAIGVDGTIYMSCLGRVYALNGTTGAVKWITSASGPYVASSPAIGADGTVYGSFANVHAFDGVTGAFKWSTEGATSYGMRWSFPAIGADGTVFVCSWNNVYAFDGGTGALKWVYSIFVSNLGNSLSPAIGADGTVYVGSSDGRVFALNGATGTVKWNYFTSRTASSPVIGRDGTVYVVSADSKVYALDGITGVLKWSFAIAGGLFMSPVIGADGTIYLGSQDNKTYAIVDCPSGQYCTPRASSWSTYVLSDGNSSVSVSISRPEYGTIFSPGFFPSLVSFRPAKFFLAKSPSPAPGIVEGRTSTV